MQSVSSKDNNIHKKCRCCLVEGKHAHTIDEEVMEIFRESLNLLLTRESHFPRVMCNKCVASLKKVNKFRHNVIASERQLIQSLISTPYDCVPGNQPDSYVKEALSELETEDYDYGDEDATFQNIEVPSDNAEVDIKVESNNENYTSLTIIGSTVLTRQACYTTDENNTTGPISPHKRDLKADTELVRKRKKHDSPSAQLGKTSDSESDTPLSDVKKKITQNIVKMYENTSDDRTKKNDGNITNISNDEIQFLEPNIPRSIMIKPDVIKTSPLINDKLPSSMMSDNYKIRRNIIQTLKHSTIIPFQYNAHYSDEYHCYYCSKPYQHINRLRKHTETQHVDKVDDKKLLSLMTGKCTKFIKADISIIKCRLCNEQLKTVETLIEHLTGVHEKVFHQTGVRCQGIFGFNLGSDNLKCHLCGKEFDRFVELSTHMNEHFEDHTCHVCGKAFATEQRYKEHVNSHREEKRTCQHCDATFKSKAGIRYHMQRQHFNGIVKCKACPETFTQYNLRDKHMRDEHKLEKEVLKLRCGLCQNKKLYTARGLKKHKNSVHSQNARIACELCNYSTTMKYVMKQHMDVHNGIKNFACEVCARRFAKKSTLRLHMRMHNSDKRFVCAKCGAAFVQKNALNFHMKSKHSNG